jgi:hypothetical protein
VGAVMRCDGFKDQERDSCNPRSTFEYSRLSELDRFAALQFETPPDVRNRGVLVASSDGTGQVL